MKGIIIYKSSYGSTKQYAEWLAEETGFSVADVKRVKKDEIKSADVVIIGCPVLAHRPMLAGWIQKKWKLLHGKKVVLYTTSGAVPNSPKLTQMFDRCFSDEIKRTLRYFPQGGRIIADELKGLHRFFMKLGKKMEKDPKVRAEMGKDVDNMNRDGIKPILQYVAG